MTSIDLVAAERVVDKYIAIFTTEKIGRERNHTSSCSSSSPDCLTNLKSPTKSNSPRRDLESYLGLFDYLFQHLGKDQNKRNVESMQEVMCIGWMALWIFSRRQRETSESSDDTNNFQLDAGCMEEVSSVKIIQATSTLLEDRDPAIQTQTRNRIIKVMRGLYETAWMLFETSLADSGANANPTSNTRKWTGMQTAISLCRSCIEFTGTDNSVENSDELSRDRSWLCQFLTYQFDIDGKLETINEGIAFGRASIQSGEDNLNNDSVQKTQAAQVDPVHLQRLALALTSRYSRFDVEDDLDSAIMVRREAVKSAVACELDAKHRGVFQCELVDALVMKMSGADKEQALLLADEGIGILRGLVGSVDRDDGKALDHQIRLAGVLGQKFKYGGADGRAALDEAIGILERVMERNASVDAGAEPSWTPRIRRRVMQELAEHLFVRGAMGKQKSLPDIDRSLALTHQIHDELGSSHDILSSSPLVLRIIALALGHLVRWRITQNLVDLDYLTKYAAELNDMEDMFANVSLRITYTRSSAEANHTARRFDVAMRNYEVILNLLPQSILLGRDYRAQAEELIGHNYQAGAAAASASYTDACKAVEFLEVGRAMGWARGVRMRSGLDGLEGDYPEYARRFRELNGLLERGGTTDDDRAPGRANDLEKMKVEAPWEQRFTSSERWNSLLAEIRALKGYEDFLANPKFDDLKHVSKAGPVVIINTSKWRSDAFIMTLSSLDRPQIISLSGELNGRAEGWSKGLLNGIEKVESGCMKESTFAKLILKPLLRDLWEEVVLPIRQCLQALDPYARRIWWCPTGWLTYLPLHLCTNGPGLDGKGGFLQLIPSYTSTLSSLLRARSTPLTLTEPIRLLAVSGEAAKGFNALPGTSKEVKHLESLKLIEDITVFQGTKATVQDVLKGISTHSWLHLACHGIQSSSSPNLSHFVLDDGPLYMSDITSTKLSNAGTSHGFAFLSACQTATGIPALSNEAMHLAAGLQFAGFRGTIATMWSVHDQTARRLAKEVYTFLFRKRKEGSLPQVEDAAEALSWAVLKLREQGVPLSRLAPFVHIGV